MDLGLKTSPNKNYVLLEVKYECNNLDNIRFVLSFQDKKLDILKRNNWGYLWSKKIKLAVYKIITYLPKILSGNYKRKTNNSENQ